MIKTNNKYNIKFPDEIIVDNASEVLYRNQEGKLKGNKNSVRYADNRVHNNFPNKPTKGWKVVNYYEGYDGKYSRIYITNSNIKINIRADFMFKFVMTDSTVIKGEIQEPCVIGFDQSNCPMLIPESHEYYQGASYPNPDLPIPTCAKDLIIGAAYDIEGVKSTYIGELRKALRVDYDYGQITIKKQRFYVFFEEKLDRVTFRTGIGKTLVSNTISVDDKSQDQCDNILESVKKLAINSENGEITGIEFDFDSIKEVKDDEKYANKMVFYGGKQYNLKDCFVYLEQESPTKINILIKPGDDGYIKAQEIIFDTKGNKIKINYLSSVDDLVKYNYSNKMSEIQGANNYIPSKPVQKLFSLISGCLTIENMDYDPYVYWNERTLLSSNLNLMTVSGKIFPKQAIVDCYVGSVRSIKL